MMAGSHPDDAFLLSYVEGELGDAERAAVEEHLAGCARCAEDVELARQGAAALRGAPALEGPDGIPMPELPERRRLLTPARRRFVAVAAPVAAGLAIVAGIATVATLGGSGNGGGNEGAGGAAATHASSQEASGGQTQADQGALKTKAPFARRVEGPPRDVARTLREHGFEARARGGHVVVRTDRKRDLARTLSSLPSGGVRIVVRP